MARVTSGVVSARDTVPYLQRGSVLGGDLRPSEPAAIGRFVRGTPNIPPAAHRLSVKTS